jgi:hypothetical protein
VAGWVIAGALWMLAITALIAVLFSFAGHVFSMVGHVDALKAAGAIGKGGAIRGLAHFVGAIRGNLLWAVGVILGVVVVAVGLMFLSGHSRAQDYALKAGAGVAIIACATGIVA